VSAELGSLIAACCLCEGEELETDSADYEVAINQINRWFEHYCASTSAGVAGSRSRARKRLLTRIESAIQSAPPHVRTRRSRAAARARNVATSAHGAAIEAELEALVRSPLPDEDWLEAVAKLETTHRSSLSVFRPASDLKIHALLLLR
jgi:hypothetical protein